MTLTPLIIGYGNPGRGDDALGPLLLERLGERDDCERLTCFQLQPEQIFELKNRPLVLFVDASLTVPAPFSLSRVEAEAGFSFSSHMLTPGALLSIYESTLQHSSPPGFLLSIRGERFGLGETLSTAAKCHLEAATHHLSHLLEKGEFLVEE